MEGVGKKESNKERKKELGEFGGCGGEGISGCSMSHQGGLPGETKRGWGRLEGQAYQCVCGDRGEQAGCLIHNRMEKESKGQDFMAMFNVHRTSRWSSNTAERLGVYRYLMKHPSTLILHQICSLAQESKGGGRRKVGHVCRFNEARKHCLTSLCFLLQQSCSLQKTVSILVWQTATEMRHY